MPDTIIGTIKVKIMGAIPYGAVFAATGCAAYWLSGGSVACAYLIVLGGMVGATTNAIAIGMLFREYVRCGSFVVGDYIGRRYKDFIGKMTGMVGKLVNYETIAPAMRTPKFKDAVKNVIRNAVEEKLPSSSGGLRLEDIDGMEKSFKNLVNLLNGAAPELVGKIIEIIGRYPIGKIISREQFECIVEKNADSMINGIRGEEPRIKEALASFLSDRNINGLLSPSAVTSIRENVGGAIDCMDFPACDGEIDAVYRVVEKELDLDGLIPRIEDAAGRMALSDFIAGVADKESVSQELLKRVAGFAETSEGNQALVDVAEKIIDSLERINLKLSDVISTGARGCLIRGIKDNLPELINDAVRHINRTGEEIERLIDEAVDEELDSGGLWGKVLSLLKDMFIRGGIAKRYNIVGYVENKVKEYGGRIGDGLTGKLLEYIEKESIGGILAGIRKVYPNMADGLVKLAIRNLRDTRGVSFVDVFLSKRIADVLAVDLSAIKSGLPPALFERFKKEYLYGPKSKAWLRRKAESTVDEYAEKPMPEYLDAGETAAGIIDAAIGDSAAFRGFLLKLYDDLSKTWISKIIPADLKPDKSMLWERGKNLKLGEIYDLFGNDGFYASVAENFPDLLERNPDSIGEKINAVLEKEITNVASVELNKFPKEKVVETVYDFIGTHLGTITAIGAGAGIAVSAALYWVFNLIGYNELFLWPDSPYQWVQSAVTVAIMALVGWGTNCLAIWALFHPYEAKWWRFNFVGIAVRGRKKFSEGIARFINENALDGGAVKKFFSLNKPRVKKGLTQYMEKNDYGVIDNLMKDPETANRIRAFVLDKTETHIRENPSRISEELVRQLNTCLKSGKLKGRIPDIDDSLLKIINERPSRIANGLIAFLADRKPEDCQERILKLVDTIYGKFVDRLDRESINKYLISKDDYLRACISDKTLRAFLRTLFGDKAVSGVSRKLSSLIPDKLPDMIPFLIDKIEKTELDADKSVKDMFNGKLRAFFKKQIKHITGMIHEGISMERGAIKAEIHKRAGLLGNIAAGKKIDNVIDSIIDGKLKAYLRSQSEFFENAGDRVIFNKTLSDFGIRDGILVKEKLENGVESILRSPEVVEGLRGIAERAVKNLSKIHVKEFLAVLGITGVSDVLAVAEPIIDRVYPHVFARLGDKAAKERVSGALRPLIVKLTDGVTPARLLSGVDLEKELANIIKNVLKDAGLTNALKAAMNAAFVERLATGKLEYGESLLREELSAFIALLVEENWREAEGAANSALDKLLAGINSAITPQTKRRLFSDVIVNALIDSCEDNADAVIRAMDVSEIVRREIGGMPPKDIEGLFEFAEGYFRTIKAWGFAGGLQAAVVIVWLVDEGRVIWDGWKDAGNGRSA